MRRSVTAALAAALIAASVAAQLGAQRDEPSTTFPDEPTAGFAPTKPPEAAPTPPASPAPAAPAPGLERVAFEFKVPPERGGGNIAGSAGAVETSGESEVTLSGGVEIKYRDLTFRAERVVFHRDTMTVEAEGDVVFDQASRRVAAERADFDLATETGSFWNASAFAEPDQYLQGEVLVKTGEASFEIETGVVTSCVGDATPDWSFRVGSATVELGGYAHLKHTRMHVKKLPIFYLPYMIWPAKTERASGFLIPNVGYTRTRGMLLGLAYYQVLGPSADVTLHLDGYENRYSGAGVELRYAPAEGTEGEALYQLLTDRDASLEETRFTWRHTTERLPGGFRAVVDVNHYSDYDFFREFQRGEKENTRSFLYSNAFLSGNWGAHSLSMIVDQRGTFRSGADDVTQRQLPDISYRLRKLKFGKMPLYLSLQSTATYIQSEDPGVFDVDYGRFDLEPELTLPLKVAPWLSASLSAVGKGTWWGESVPVTVVDPVTALPTRVCESGAVSSDQRYCGETLTRTVGGGTMQVVGPSFSRIFESPGGRFSKLKHVIEPRFEYGYASEFDEQNRVARFDEIDAATAQNSVRAALVNRVLAKPSDAEEGGAFEIFSFELAQLHSLEDEKPLQRSSNGLLTKKEGPILAQLRYSPGRTFNLQGRASWSTLFESLNSTSLSMRGKGKRAGVDLTWYTDYNAETSVQRSDQARVGFDLDIVPQRLSLNAQVNYDLEGAELQQHRYFVNYRSQCWSVLLEYREQLTSSFETQDYRFLLTLKNVGTFLDMHSGESTDRY